jgi:hypothetical protein
MSESAEYPVRSREAGSKERLGLGANAPRVTIESAGGTTILDMYIGNADAAGNEVYLCRAGEDTVRSGADVFTSYVTGGRNYWFDLRIFPDHDKNGMDVASVQRITVHSLPVPATGPEGEAGEGAATQDTYSISRSGKGWTFDGDTATAVDTAKADAFARAILDAEADSIDTGNAAAPSGASEGACVVEFGNGQTVTLSLGAEIPAENGGAAKTPASVRGIASGADSGGSPYVYMLSKWAVQSLLKAKADLAGAAQEATNASSGT